MIFEEMCHAVAKNNLVRACSGNVSQRYNDNSFLITRSGCWLENVSKLDIVECNLKDNKVIENFLDYKPSSEILMHSMILNTRPDINVVLHFQSTYVTILACKRFFPIFDLNVIPEIPCYIDSVDIVEFEIPGSLQLAKAVTEKICKNDLVILQNHGAVVVGKSLEETLEKAIFFEFACEIMFKNDHNIREINKKDFLKIREIKNVKH